MDWERLKFYLDGVGEASKRSRVVFYIILLSSAMIFAFYWKTREGSWLEHRINLRHSLLNHWEELKSPTYTDHVSDEERKRLRGALEKMGIGLQTPVDKDFLQRQLYNLDDQFNGTFKVPFVDVTFDINDFLLFSSLQLNVLAIVFLFCLIREEETLRISFESVREAGIHPFRDFYKMAGMHQIWNIPGGSHKSREFLLRMVTWLLFLFPLVAEWWIFIDDRMTAGAWNILDKSFGNRIVIFEYILMISLTVTTVMGASIFNRMSDHWDKAYEEIHAAEK